MPERILTAEGRLAAQGSVPLVEAPAMLFPDRRARLVALKCDEPQARAALARPDPGMTTHLRRELIASNDYDPRPRAEALAAEELYILVDALRADLLARGRKGRIVASRLYAGTGQRQNIPAELWREKDIALDFEAGRFAARGLGHRLINRIQIRIAASLTRAR